MVRRVTSAAVAVALLLIAACSTDGEPSDASPSPAPRSDLTTADGLRMERNGVVVDIPAGAVPAGTDVDLSRRGDPAPSVLDYAVDAGPGYDLTLGGVQPDIPIDLTVPVDLAPDAGGSTWALVLESESGEVDLVEASYDPGSRTVSGQVPHLSGIWPVRIDLAPLWATVSHALQVEHPEPACAGETAKLGRTTYSVDHGTAAWMCVAAVDGDLQVTASPSTAVPFLITGNRPMTKPQAVQDLTVSTVVIRALVDRLYADGIDQAIMFAGSDALVRFEGAPRGVRLEFEQLPPVFLLQILGTVLEAVIGGVDDKTLEAIGNLECLANLPFSELGKGITPGAVSGVHRSFFDCVEPVLAQSGKLPGPQRVVLAIISGAPSLLVGQLVAALNEVTGQGRFTVSVDQDIDAVAPEEIQPFLGSWTGDVDQSGSSYSVRLRLSYADGRIRGTVRYPELGSCAGYLADAVVEDGTLVVTENITRGSQCLEEVKLALTPRDGGLDYDADDGLATGFLTRSTPIDDASVAPYLGVWEGAVDQPSSSRPYTVSLRLAWNGTALVGSTVYPELGGCRADLRDFELVDGALVAAEVVTFEGDRCVDTVLELRVQGDTMSYLFEDPEHGTGMLRRRP